jgi:hypothetical protein
MYRRQRNSRFSQNPTGKKGFDCLFILDDLTATLQWMAMVILAELARYIHGIDRSIQTKVEAI